MKKVPAYTTTEVADVAKVSRRTVYSWITSGDLPAHKAGPKLWRVYPDVLAAFLLGGAVEARKADAKILLALSGGSVSTAKPVPVVKPSPLAKPATRPVQSSQSAREAPGEVTTATLKPMKNKPKQAGRRR